MNGFQAYSSALVGSTAVLLLSLIAGCSDPLLGMEGDSGIPPVAADETRPRVTVTQPATTSPGPTLAVPAPP